MKKIIATLVFCCFFAVQYISAQTTENSDFFRNIGKMYVVVTTVAITFIGIVIFLWRLDKKLTNLEKQMNND